LLIFVEILIYLSANTTGGIANISNLPFKISIFDNYDIFSLIKKIHLIDFILKIIK